MPLYANQDHLDIRIDERKVNSIILCVEVNTCVKIYSEGREKHLHYARARERLLSTLNILYEYDICMLYMRLNNYSVAVVDNRPRNENKARAFGEIS